MKNKGENQESTKTLGEKDNLQYQGILEADTLIEDREKFLRKTRKFLEPKLRSKSLIKGISTLKFHLVRYSGLFLKLTRREHRQKELKGKDVDIHNGLTPER